MDSKENRVETFIMELKTFFTTKVRTYHYKV